MIAPPCVRWPGRLGLLPLVWMMVVGLGVTADAAGPVIAGFERFGRTPGADLAASGRLLIGELNCVACHDGPNAPLAPVAAKQAPILNQVGARVQVDHLRAYLTNPVASKPGATMPHLLRRPDAAADVEALVHFLASTGTTTPSAPNRRAAAGGRTLYEQSGCAACHGRADRGSPTLPAAVPLGPVDAKYTVTSLAEYLADPLASRPSGRMPSLDLKPAEARAIADYLLRDAHVAVTPTLTYRTFEGSWSTLPDLATLEPTATGVVAGFDLDVAPRRNNYAIRFEGRLDVDRAGPYEFFVASDDGGRISVDGRKVADNDGIHPKTEKLGRIRLDAGPHTVTVDYFDGGGEAELDVEFRGPDLEYRSRDMIRRPLAPALSAPTAEGRPAPPKFRPDPALVARGRTTFTAIGCANCHHLVVGKVIFLSTAARPPALADCRPDRGCLAPTPEPTVPDYGLTDPQRSALAAALRPEVVPPSPSTAVDRTLLAFNCYACHRRGEVGGVEPEYEAFFTTTQKEMGDEGRIPPLLTGVGGKLNAEYLRQVLVDGAKDRPYMRTRMPQFGIDHVDHLVATLERLDAVAPVAAVTFDETDRRTKGTGRFLVGSKAFNCGGCHKFGEHEAQGIQAIDMTLMTKRLRHDWFARYVVDPPAFRPGTRMPTSWPNGVSTLDTVYGGDTPRQVESIWRYLGDGSAAAVPEGLGRDPIPLVATAEPVLYRNFIQGAGPRAIGVGYPEKVNVAFDANDLRVALIWSGAFIDAARHWTGRGEGYQPPLGDNVIALPPGPTVTRLARPDAPWPTHAAKGTADHFRGYRLVDRGRPVFLYDVGPIHVEEAIAGDGASNPATLRRTLTMGGDPAGTGPMVRLAVGRAIDPLPDGWFRVDGEYRVRVVGAGAPTLRPAGARRELVAPIPMGAGATTITLEYAW